MASSQGAHVGWAEAAHLAHGWQDHNRQQVRETADDVCHLLHSLRITNGWASKLVYHVELEGGSVQAQKRLGKHRWQLSESSSSTWAGSWAYWCNCVIKLSAKPTGLTIGQWEASMCTAGAHGRQGTPGQLPGRAGPAGLGRIQQLVYCWPVSWAAGSLCALL